MKNQENSKTKKSQTIVYIDGFNLFFGLKNKHWKRYYWLDVNKLSQKILKPSQHLISVKYFTSLVSSTKEDPKKDRRQLNYLEALSTNSLCAIFYGHYLRKTVRCKKCGNTWETHEEKMTDVNIGVEMLNDAYKNQFDTAILISGDSDLMGPIEMVRKQFSEKRIVVAFPPKLVSNQHKKVSHAYFTIGRKIISESQFPDRVVKEDGFVLKRPEMWR